MRTTCSLLTLILLAAVAGCGSTSSARQGGDMPLPGATTETRESGTGMLLRTGAIQLGPDVGRNQWHWQGDGKGGF